MGFFSFSHCENKCQAVTKLFIWAIFSFFPTFCSLSIALLGSGSSWYLDGGIRQQMVASASLLSVGSGELFSPKWVIVVVSPLKMTAGGIFLAMVGWIWMPKMIWPKPSWSSDGKSQKQRGWRKFFDKNLIFKRFLNSTFQFAVKSKRLPQMQIHPT